MWQHPACRRQLLGDRTHLGAVVPLAEQTQHLLQEEQ